MHPESASRSRRRRDAERASEGAAASSVLGVDGCRTGWIAVRWDGASAYEVKVLPDIEAVWAWRAGEGLVLIDVPIGLWDAGPEPRACDAMARRLLGAPRASSVFTPPVRPACAARSWREASALNASLTGRSLSRQAFGIAPKIREVDAFLRADPGRQAHLREAHPELLFWALNGGRAMAGRKKSKDGREERLAVLARHAPEVREVFERELPTARAGGAAPDDLVDALVAVVAARASGGLFRAIPETPERDAQGLRMEMLHPEIPGLRHDGRGEARAAAAGRHRRSRTSTGGQR